MLRVSSGKKSFEKDFTLTGHNLTININTDRLAEFANLFASVEGYEIIPDEIDEALYIVTQKKLTITIEDKPLTISYRNNIIAKFLTKLHIDKKDVEYTSNYDEFKLKLKYKTKLDGQIGAPFIEGNLNYTLTNDGQKEDNYILTIVDIK